MPHLKVNRDVLQRHGNDPNSPSIAATAFVLAIRATHQIDPNIEKKVIKLLSEESS